MKGIILAGGNGTRLFPMTRVISKQLLPIYDKPLIYYPLSVLLLAGIREILIISSPKDIELFRDLLGDGQRLGLKIEYTIQVTPKGIGEAFIIGETFIKNDNVCLILGDNLLYGQGLSMVLKDVIYNLKEATIFGYPVKNPSEFGVAEFNERGEIIGIEEKPIKPKSRYAVPGLYFYNSDVVNVAKSIQPSERGELEITAINSEYLLNKKLKCELLGRGMAWLDTGTPNGMLQASQYVETVQERQGLYIACIEEIAWRNKYISDSELFELGHNLKNTDYGKYILSLINK